MHGRGSMRFLLGLVGGLVLGAGLSGGRLGPRTLHAGGGDRPDASLVLSGPIATETNPSLKIQITNDAVYYLNYSRGRLLAAVPMQRVGPGGAQVLSDFAERDLVQDFQLAPGTEPHFALTTGTMGSMSEGWAPLYVFETTTGQVAIYRVHPQSRPGSSQPTIQLLEKRSDPRLSRAGVRTASR